MQPSPRVERVLQSALVLSIIGYVLGRSYEAALYLSGEMLQATDACRGLPCALALQFHLWAGYLCAPLAIAALAVLAKSTRAFVIFGGGFLLLKLSSDLAALAALWNYYAFSFSGPNREMLVDLTVPRYGRDLSSGAVHVDRMAPTLSQQFAAVRFEVAHEIAALHPLAIFRGSRITSPSPTSSRARARLASRTISTASRRFARASSRVAP